MDDSAFLGFVEPLEQRGGSRQVQIDPGGPSGVGAFDRRLGLIGGGLIHVSGLVRGSGVVRGSGLVELVEAVEILERPQTTEVR
jgi:hypothetical protein